MLWLGSLAADIIGSVALSTNDQLSNIDVAGAIIVCYFCNFARPVWYQTSMFLVLERAVWFFYYTVFNASRVVQFDDEIAGAGL